LDIAGRRRCFVFSYNKDKRNYTYELSTFSGKDLSQYDIESFYVSKKYNFGAMKPKMLKGGHGVRLSTRGRTELAVEFRPDDTPCWYPMGQKTALGCDGCEDASCSPFRQANSMTMNLAAPKPGECLEGSKDSNRVGEEFQFKLALKGDNDVKFLLVNSDEQPEDETVTCPQPCRPITCCTEYDFSYQWP
jgi:hypothetical protein